MSFTKRELSTSQIYGSGLALILIMLLISLFGGSKAFVQAAAVLTILLMVWPAPFRYFAIVWFAFAEVLGYITSRILLTVIFLLVVIPVGLMKRGSLRQTLKTGLFKKGCGSVFVNRNHTFTADDLLKPF